MNDYINIKDDRFWQILFDEACVEGKQAERIQNELEQITISETEILRKPFGRVVERLEERVQWYEVYGDCEGNSYRAYDHAIEIVKEECGISE